MFNRRFLISAVSVFLATISMTAWAAGDAENGAELATTCMGCHGIVGYRNAYPSYRVPKLGGQSEEYIVIALQGYKNETRGHATMQAHAATLSEQDMQDIAAFFASQGGLEEGSPRSGAQIARGQEKATVCTACHGQGGVSTTSNWPSLAGQHEDYVKHVLTQYQSGERTDPVMAGQAANLSAQDVADLAAYFAAMPGLYTVSYAD